MITLETGAPGAGKTLYCIDKLLRPLIGSTVSYERPDGTKETIPRVFYSNINGLLLDHQKIGPDELNNWHEWAKPGAVIIYDEVQKPWPLAASGSKVPPCIQALETHRHMGVDFIVITQHPMLVHSNVMRLVGRHLHIRRMGNMGLSIVYEWDGSSKTLLYKNALAKAAYKYDKSVFDLYKSAEVHTKQKRSVPTLVYGFVFALAGLAFFGPMAWSRIGDRVSGVTAVTPSKTVVSAPVPVVKPPTPQNVFPVPTAAQIAATAPAAPSGPPAAPAGCVVGPKRCGCFTASGAAFPLDDSACRTVAGEGRPPVYDLGPDTVRPVDRVLATGDLELARFMASNRGKPPSSLDRQMTSR